MSWVRLAVEGDITQIAPKLRQADKQEVWASGGYSPEEALRVSYRASEPCYAFVGPKGLQALFGVAPTVLGNSSGGTIGAIWLLGTDAIDTNPITFLRWSRNFLPFLIQPYDMVCNLVHAKNTLHIKWLRWLGFSVIRQVEHGPEHEPFYEFARLK